jgi:hypothetical protein
MVKKAEMTFLPFQKQRIQFDLKYPPSIGNPQTYMAKNLKMK